MAPTPPRYRRMTGHCPACAYPSAQLMSLHGAAPVRACTARLRVLHDRAGRLVRSSSRGIARAHAPMQRLA